MRRRDLIKLIASSAAAWPVVAQAQPPALPLIGYLSSRSPSNSADIIAAFRRGLGETGFVDGQNVIVESRFADGEFDQLPALAGELIARNVNVFVATGALFRRSRQSRWYREQFRWFLRWAATRSNSALSRASIVLGTISRALLSWSMDWQPSKLNCCIN